MKVKILAFGITREIFGNASIDIELNTVYSVSALKSTLEELYPRLKQLASYMIAVNNEYAYGDEVITPIDEIAVIPPVSGG
jgi:molybdopterin synthase sulfur carrier subunit